MFEYYLEAPGFLGGGLTRRRRSLPRCRSSTPPKDTGHGPNSPRNARSFAAPRIICGGPSRPRPQRIGRFIDLAKFLAKQGRFQEADQSIAKAEKIAPNSPKLVYAKADMYIKTGGIWMLRRIY